MLQAKSISIVTVLFLLAASMAVASGCGAAAGVGAVTSNIVGGFAVKGPIIDGTVFAYVQNSDGSKGALLSEGTTDERGAFELSLEDYSGCVRLEVVSGTYKDEATGRIVDLAVEGIVLLGLVPDYDPETGLTDISITPLTSIAASLAIETLEEDGGDPAVAAATANAQVASYFGLDDIITSPPPDLTNEDDPYDGEMNDAAAAAVIIAGLSELAADSGVSAMELIGALAEDYSDGVFDGAADGETVGLGGADLSADMTTTELASGIEDFVESENNTSVVNTEDVGEITDIVAGGGGAPPPIPSIAYIDPIEGDIDGGTVVTIWGENLDLVEGVRFGENEADFDVFSDIYLEVKSFNGVGNYYIEAIAPAGDDDGTVTVSVRGSGGIGDSLANAFTYISVRQAVVSSVTENWGSFTGGTVVTIAGLYFEPDALVYFGSNLATGVSVTSTTSLTCSVPAGDLGTADVIVANPGVLQGTLADGFTYTYGDVLLAGKSWSAADDYAENIDPYAISPEGENVYRHWYYYDRDGNGMLLFETSTGAQWQNPMYEQTLVYDDSGYGHMAFYDDTDALWYGYSGADKAWGTSDDVWSMIYEYSYYYWAPEIMIDADGYATVFHFDENYGEYYVWFDADGDRTLSGEETHQYVADANTWNTGGSAAFDANGNIVWAWLDTYEELSFWHDANGDFVIDDPAELSSFAFDIDDEIDSIDLAVDPDGNVGVVFSAYIDAIDSYDVYYWYDANGNFEIDEGEVETVDSDYAWVTDVSVTFDAGTTGYPAIVGYMTLHQEMMPKAKQFDAPPDGLYYGQWTDGNDDGVVDGGELATLAMLYPSMNSHADNLDLVWLTQDGETVLSAAFVFTIEGEGDTDYISYMIDGFDGAVIDGLFDPLTELVVIERDDLLIDEGIAFAPDGNGQIHLIANYYDGSNVPFGIEIFDADNDGTMTGYSEFGIPLKYKLYASYYNASDGSLTTPTYIEGGLPPSPHSQPIVMFDGSTGDAVIVYRRHDLFDASEFGGKSGDVYLGNDLYGIWGLFYSEFDKSAGTFIEDAIRITADGHAAMTFGFVSDGLIGEAVWEGQSWLDYHPYTGFGSSEDEYVPNYNGYWSESKKPSVFDDYLGVVALIEDWDSGDDIIMGWAWSPGNSFGAAQAVEFPAEAGYPYFDEDYFKSYDGNFFVQMYKDATTNNCVYWGSFDGTVFSPVVTRISGEGESTEYFDIVSTILGPDEGLDAIHFLSREEYYDGMYWMYDSYLYKLDDTNMTYTAGWLDGDAEYIRPSHWKISKDGDYIAILYGVQDVKGNECYLAARVFDVGTDPSVAGNIKPDPQTVRLTATGDDFYYVYEAYFQRNEQGDNAKMSFWYNDDWNTDACGFNQLIYDGTDVSLQFADDTQTTFCSDMAYWYGGDWYWQDKGVMKNARSEVAEFHADWDSWWYDEDYWSVQLFDDGNGGAIIYYMAYDDQVTYDDQLRATRYVSDSPGLEAPEILSGPNEVEYYIVRGASNPEATKHHILWQEGRDDGYNNDGLFHREHDLTAATFGPNAFSPATDSPANIVDVSADPGYRSDLVSAWVDKDENLYLAYFNGDEFNGGGELRKESREPFDPFPGIVFARSYFGGVWGAEELMSIDDMDWGAAYNGWGIKNNHSTANMLNCIFDGETFGNGDIQAFMLLVTYDEGWEGGGMIQIKSSNGMMNPINGPYKLRLFVKVRR